MEFKIDWDERLSPDWKGFDKPREIRPVIFRTYSNIEYTPLYTAPKLKIKDMKDQVRWNVRKVEEW